MSRTTAALLAVLLCTVAIPAEADWDRIGSIDVAARQMQEFNMENFKGNVIGLTARESDVMCDRVTAIFADGDTRRLFRGKLPKGLSIRVDLPPGAVQRVTFSCHAIRGSEATIDLAADNGFLNNPDQSRG
jgi:hypothetical protein